MNYKEYLHEAFVALAKAENALHKGSLCFNEEDKPFMPGSYRHYANQVSRLVERIREDLDE